DEFRFQALEAARRIRPWLEAMPYEIELRPLLLAQRRDPELLQHVFEYGAVYYVDLLERRRAAAHPVHGGPAAGAPGLGELDRVDTQPFCAREAAYLARNRPVPIDNGAKNVESERFDCRGLSVHCTCPLCHKH